MKKYLVILVIIFALITTGCFNKEDSDTNENTLIENEESATLPFEESFVPVNPYDELDNETLKELKADGFEGTDEQIANQILVWQQNNMEYIGDPNVKPDISYSMRWNYMIPGIFPVKDMVQERLLNNGKIYGLCWDYAAIYNAIANSYGLEVRVTALKKYLSDINPQIDESTKEGLSEEEYKLLNVKLSNEEAEYSYSQIDRVARETWVHYRAEVKIDDKWIAMDGTPSVTDEYKTGNFEVAPWDEGYNNEYLNAPTTLDGDTLKLDNLVTLLEYAPFEGYVGITDDNGDKERAASFKDLARGRGLVPYFEDKYDVASFLKLPSDQIEEILDDVDEILSDYEKNTGKKFYMLADFLLYSDTDENFDYKAEEYVRLYNGLTGSNMTEAEFNEYIN